ncbi:uncharacterized protein LOC126598867 isoform X2 [Malus sylvestris]|uniref:uncharacterized protein LOC126598867 isoform X2 n=1 Tax=Malus sylvestris TaxID=3752 RepID=UPI0021ABE3B2|nr:uncharacterized protein LOC126598867 isoform X2 [Malus sylvestris]
MKLGEEKPSDLDVGKSSLTSFKFTPDYRAFSGEFSWNSSLEIVFRRQQRSSESKEEDEQIFRQFLWNILTASGETYPEDEHSQGRLGDYDPSTYQTMPPRREPRHSAEPSFPDIAQLGEAIANAIQSSLRPPQMTSLQTVYNLKLNHFMGNEGHEGAEKWLNHIEKTFLVM